MSRKIRTTTILTSIALVLVIAAMSLSSTKAYSQFMKSYRKLTKPERHWVLWHPVAAFRTHTLADTAKREAIRRLKDPDLDGDINGGMVDAFKHTLWMALNAQRISPSKALSLGEAHEESAKLEFLADPSRKTVGQDSIASRMDILNNIVGVDIGSHNPKASYTEIVSLVKQAVVDGRCWKIKKVGHHKYLDDSNEVINIHDYDGKWNIPKVLVPSNKSDNK